jgi:arylsulfatase A-like enzyme
MADPAAWARRIALVIGAVALVIAFMDRSMVDVEQSGPLPPNILLIVTDDQTFDPWWAMPEVRHDILDHGVRFTKAYVSNPLCCPSRAAILTGGYSHTTGVYGNAGEHGGFRSLYARGGEANTLATALDPTYDTALFGKYLNGYATYSERVLHRAYVPPGWNEWQAFFRDNGAYYNYRLNVDGELVRYGDQPASYSTDVLGERLRDWLDPTDGVGRDPTEPFFAYLAAFSPHLPSDASPTFHDAQRFTRDRLPHPAGFNEADVSDKPTYIRNLPRITAHEEERLRTRWQAQLASLASYDRQIGLTIDLLRQQDQLTNTIVIILSDNGVLFGEHRWISKGVPYQEAVNVAFAIRADGFVAQPGVDRTHLVANVDVYPTVLDLALGEGSPPGVDGRSLRPLLDGERDPPWRSSVLLEGPYDARGILPAVPTYCGIVTERWKYVVYSPTREDLSLVSAGGEQELYDLRADPSELDNVAASKPEVERRLRAQLAKLCSPTPPGWAVPW